MTNPVESAVLEPGITEGPRRTFIPRPGGHVVIVLPRGEAIRNFVYSGCIEALRAGGTRVSVISVRPNDAIWSDLSTEVGDGTLSELRLWRERYPVRLLREVLDVCHGRWLWSEAAKERWRLRDAEATTATARLKRAGKKAVARVLAHRPGIRLLERLERAASRRLRVSDEYLDLYRALKPTLVFNGSHVHSAHAIPAIEAAQWLGIPTAAFVFSWDNLTSQGRMMPPYPHYVVWNEALRRQLLEIYPDVPAERVYVTGTPQFDCHFRPEFHCGREEFFRRIGADPARPLVFYATGMPNHMPGEERIVEQIADVLAGIEGPVKPQLLVRVYAKDRTRRFDEVRKRRTDILFAEVAWEKNWLTPKREDASMLANTLRHYALGINVASTVSLELCMFDKPVINVGYNPPGVPESELSYARYYEFDHYKPVVRSGAVEVVRSPDAMKPAIVRALREPAAASQQRRSLVQSFFGDTLDGRSGERVARVLARLAVPA